MKTFSRYPERCLATLSLTALFAALPTAHALAQPVTPRDSLCSIRGVTEVARTSLLPEAISGDGSRIVYFQSRSPNFNPPGIPPVELVQVDLRTDSRSIILTFDDLADLVGDLGDPGEPSIPTPALDNFGTRVAFTAATNVTGENPDRNLEIFLLDTAAGSLTQITNTLGRSNIVPAMSGDGTRIAFRSIAHPAGGSPGETDLLLYDITAGTFTSFGRIPTVSESSALAFSRNGSRLAFASRADLTGENADGNEEIFLSDITTRMLTQVTRTTEGDNQSPVTNGDGTRIAFSSSANLTGENLDGNLEVVLFDVTTATATQVTQTTIGETNLPGALSDDGTRITVTHAQDNDYELFLVDVANGTHTSVIARLVSGNQTIGLGRMSADAARIAFRAPVTFPIPTPPNGSILAATCGSVVNDLVSLTALPETFQTNRGEDDGCPPLATAGTFSFLARLQSIAGSAALTDLQVRVHTLTNLHRQKNVDGGLSVTFSFRTGGPGSGLTVPRIGEFADGVLAPGEMVDVPFVFCLSTVGGPFQFFVDVLGSPH